MAVVPCAFRPADRKQGSVVLRKSQDIPLEELFSIVFEDRPFSGLLMLIKAYIDDSADERQERVVIAGSFVGLLAQWRKFRKEWKRALADGGGLRYFRSTEYYSLRGEFERFRDRKKFPKPFGSEAAKHLRSNLHKIIGNCGIVGMATCIPIPMYQNKIKSNLDTVLLGRDAFEVAVNSLLRETCKSIREELGDNQKVSFVCDEGPNSVRLLELYRNFKKLHPDEAMMMESFNTFDDKRVPPLQAADLMASLAKETYSKWSLGSARLMEPSNLKDSVFSISCWTEETFEAATKREKLISSRYQE